MKGFNPAACTLGGPYIIAYVHILCSVDLMKEIAPVEGN